MATEATTTSFGYWVRRRRLALDLTQADLARAVNCATVTIAKIERDERRPSRQMAALLAEQLAVPAGERTRFLAAAMGEIAVDRLALNNEVLQAPPPKSDRLSGNLPTPATPFVGRESELSQLAAALADPTCRLLTLLGAGGFGKTRLAICLGERAMAAPEQFPDGVFFVALEGLEGGEFLVPAAAAALAFSFYEQEDQERQLLGYLAPKRLLLILDNAEEILDPDVVLRMLAAAPGVRLLVTSRESLNLQQEWLHPIGGMDVDSANNSGGEEDRRDRQQPEPDAVLLFRQCALRVQPTFDLERELVHVRHICRLVEGAPLAIELAATWLKALPCSQVARELTRGIDLLATSMRDVPLRHRSMRAVLEQSWGYLAEDEQQVFRQLSIFEGGFRLEAAQAVVEAPLRVLAALAAKSMLQLDPDGRYHIHALLRQLGAEHLAARPAEMAACRARHAAYYMSFLAERREPLAGKGQMVALREIQEEMDNVRAAWFCTAAQGSLLSLGKAQPALFRFLWMRGRYAEGEQLAHQALESSHAETLTDEDQLVRIALAAQAAHFAGAMGSYDRALAGASMALAAAQRHDIAGEMAHCHYVLGMLQAYLLDEEAAIANLSAAYALYLTQDDPTGTAEAAGQLGFNLWALKGELESASALVEESLDRYRALGNQFDLADALNQAALLQWYAGDVEQAERLYQDSLHTARAVGNRLVALQAVGGLALVAMAREQWELAIQLQHERLAMAQQLGHDNQVKNSLSFLAAFYVTAERFTEALAVLKLLPETWHNAYTAQAYVGTGAYGAAYDFLYRATAEQLASDSAGSYVSILMVGWAMLLTSSCTLQIAPKPAMLRPIEPHERTALAVEVLAAAHAYWPTDPATRAQAGRLLARQYAAMGALPRTMPPARSIQELARELLTLRLG